MTRQVIVVGAGICGVSTALWLRRSGHDVLLLDKGAPGQGASFGNAGLLAGWAVVPVNTPELWRDAPRYLLDRDGALFLKWAQLPGLVPWLIKFLSHARDTKTRKIVGALAPLLLDSVDQHRALVRGTPLETWVHDSSFSYVYRDRRAFDADRYSWDLKAGVGIVPEVITGPAVQEAEPILGRQSSCLAVIHGHGHVSDPGTYVSKLADQLVAEGGRVIEAELQDVHRDGDRVTRIDTSAGGFDCDRLVITAGIWSGDLMRKIGLKIPLAAERGYHVLFKEPSQLPRNPMMIAAGKFAVNPMDMGLRCAGTVELGDHHAGPSKAPVAMIERHARRVFPDLQWSGTETWLGFRPTLPDSTPIIGEVGNSGIFAGFGHQHVGLTSGPKTGRLLAQLIDGTSPNFDMAPFDANRFTQ